MGIRAPLEVLVVVLLSSCTLYCRAARRSRGDQGTPNFCGEHSDAEAAEEIFQAHKSSVHKFLLTAIKDREYNDRLADETLFAKAGMSQFRYSKIQCFIRLHYSANTREVVLGEPRFQDYKHCKSPVYNIRTRIYHRIFNWLAADQEVLGLHLERDFEFFVDVTDGTQGDQYLFELLSLPTLAMSRSPKHRGFVIPIPDLHTMYALAQAGQRSVPQMRRVLPENVRRNAEELHKMFTFRFPQIPWKNKTSQLVYRGTCTPTISPVLDDKTLTDDHWLYLPVRSDICTAITGLPQMLVDVGFITNNPDGCNSIIESPYASTEMIGFCLKCKACEAPPLKREAMMGYKYILNVDGYGFTFDAMWWKLASGSVVFQVNDKDNPNEFIYEPWYAPLLKPRENYLPVAPDKVFSALESCIMDDHVCSEIGEAARKLARCKLTLNAAKTYLAKVLQYMHDVYIHGVYDSLAS